MTFLNTSSVGSGGMAMLSKPLYIRDQAKKVGLRCMH